LFIFCSIVAEDGTQRLAIWGGALGFSISWVCFRGLEQAEVLRRTGLRDTGVVDEANETPFSMSRFPRGWLILWSNDILYASPERLAELSNKTMLVSGQAEEHVMYCGVSAFENGREIWSVEHDAQKGLYDIAERGRPPNEYAAIKSEQIAEQKQWGEKKVEGLGLGVDYIFEIPKRLCLAVTGFTYDRWRYDWGEPRFTKLVHAVTNGH
jgi:hypothetical protein